MHYAPWFMEITSMPGTGYLMHSVCIRVRVNREERHTIQKERMEYERSADVGNDGEDG